MATILVAARDSVYRLTRAGAEREEDSLAPAPAPSGDAPQATRNLREARGMRGLGPTCLAVTGDGRAWCGTASRGVRASDDGGESWSGAGLEGVHVMALTADPVRPGVVWAGAEPSGVRVAEDGPGSWVELGGLMELPSSDTWSFPPRPDTHHVRWIACHPHEAGRLWVAVEAGALISSRDGGHTWVDRVPGSPYDTHELAVHPDRPDVLRVAAGDGYFESHDAGASWTSPQDGLEVGYLRSVAIDPGDADVVVVSASSTARTAYAAGQADGRVFRRAGGGRWKRVTEGWPEEPSTIAPLLRAHPEGGFLAADERGVHRSVDGGATWRRLAAFPEPVGWLRGLAVMSHRS